MAMSSGGWWSTMIGDDRQWSTTISDDQKWSMVIDNSRCG